MHLDEKALADFAGAFLHGETYNPVYDCNVWFAPGVKLREPAVCQIVGNLGGWVENAEIDLSTDFVIIPDAMVEALKCGRQDPLLVMLEKKINGKGRKYDQLRVISEGTLVAYVRRRVEKTGDEVMMNLLKQSL